MLSYNFKYNVTIKQQLILLGHLIFITICFVGYGVYLYVTKSLIDNKGYKIVFAVFLLIDTLPTLIVHTQYWLKNHGSTFIIDTQTKELMYGMPKKQVSYSFNDISLLQYFRSLGKGSGWHSFGEYRYYKIIFKDKTEIVITCLMINDIENTLEMLLRMKAERHAKVLCLI